MVKKRICIVSSYPLAVLRGGLDIQAVRTYEEMALAGNPYEYEFFDWGAKELADAYHFFGAPPHLWEIIESVRAAGRPYVIHLLSGERQTFLNGWLRDKVKRTLGLRSNSSILEHAAVVAMITEDERDLLRRAYSIPPENTVVIPNFVDEAYYDATAEAWQRQRGDHPFLLCVGMVQQRKNQLLLARAANAEKLPLVLIGAPLPGEDAYAAQVGLAMQENAAHGGEWIKGLEKDDPLLISAHRACRAFVLLSKAETQPFSVLQAMAAGRPVLLGNSFYTKSVPFASLPHKVDLESFSAIRAGLKTVWNRGETRPLSEIHRTKNIVQALTRLHERVLNSA